MGVSQTDDELLSVNDVARLWGTGLEAVLGTIRSGELSTLDRGLLIDEGRHDVPLIRRSWMDAVQQASPGFGRILRSGLGDPYHPAIESAFDFHKALDLADAAGLYAVSSRASREQRSPDELLEAWQDIGSHLLSPGAGIGTAIYDLAPIRAVTARVFAHTPALPRALERATPATLLDVLPLVHEADGWRVDLPLFERREEWCHTISESPPESPDVEESESSTGAGGSVDRSF